MRFRLTPVFRHLIAVSALALSATQPALASKEGSITPRGGAAPAVSVISGSPLTVRVGDEHSYQILNADVPGVGQVYPSGSSGTADMGWMVRAGSVLYSPDFANHSSGSATGSLGATTAYAGRSISPVSGAGTTASPFQVTVSNTLGDSDLSTTEVVRYVNGDNYFSKRFTVTNHGASAQDVSIFLGGDIYLAGSDSGHPYLETASSSPGGRNCATPSTYYILYIPQTPADGYTGSSYSDVWSQIGSGSLSNSLTSTSCLDNGAALQWNRTIPANSSVTILAATSFGEIPGIAQFDITSVTPDVGHQGTTVNVTIGGIGFADGMQVGFGAGITVSNLVVIDANTATATLTIDPAATLGLRDVTGINADASLTATLTDGFEVIADGATPFQINSVTPASGAQGTTVNVTIHGAGFDSGLAVTFGAGITVSNLVVVDAGTATATLTIAAGASIGPRDVTGTQGSLSDTLANGFRVTGTAAGARPVPVGNALTVMLLMLAMVGLGLTALRRLG